uniref:Uncharacterized protein n=1 Tax=Physcomitrium patens TaxID=3218 RepID=A0A2K1IN51_PHYPA|nr:hypothetical protein PHYPA_027021 [Physcomitrium patens]
MKPASQPARQLRGGCVKTKSAHCACRDPFGGGGNACIWSSGQVGGWVWGVCVFTKSNLGRYLVTGFCCSPFAGVASKMRRFEFDRAHRVLAPHWILWWCHQSTPWVPCCSMHANFLATKKKEKPT